MSRASGFTRGTISVSSQNLRRLRELGNTVLVVEHDAETILSVGSRDRHGPGRRVQGGEIVFQGTPGELVRSETSLTGKYLSGRLSIPIPRSRRGNGSTLVIEGAGQNNLKDITVEIPLGTFTCVTGVSGSGKSSLINEILFPALAQRLYRSKTRVGKVKEITGDTAHRQGDQHRSEPHRQNPPLQPGHLHGDLQPSSGTSLPCSPNPG